MKTCLSFCFMLLAFNSQSQYREMPKSFVKKTIVVLAGNDQKSLKVIDTKELTVISEPSSHELPLNSSRCKFLGFEENKSYYITASAPGFEDQHWFFSTTQVPVHDTLFFLMIPEGTPYYFLDFFKRSYDPDSASIQVIPGTSKADKIKEFHLLMNQLKLVQETPYSNKYRKQSGANFGLTGDTILTYLRSRTDLISAAGPNLFRGDELNVLSNQVHIVWKNNPRNRSAEEVAEFEYFIKEKGLKFKSDDFYEASPEIGLELNGIVEELNQLESVLYAYPETFIPLH